MSCPRIGESLVRIRPYVSGRFAKILLVGVDGLLIPIPELTPFRLSTSSRLVMDHKPCNLLAEILVIATGIQQMEVPRCVYILGGGNGMRTSKHQEKKFAVFLNDSQ